MINEIFENAKKLRAITPYSFKLIFDDMQIFKPKCKKHKENFDFYRPDSFMCLPILPSEIFCITYTNIVKCPDDKCLNFIDLKELDNDNEFDNDSKNKENVEFELNIDGNYNKMNNDNGNNINNLSRNNIGDKNINNDKIILENNFETFAHKENEDANENKNEGKFI